MLRISLHTFAAVFTAALVLTGCKPAPTPPGEGHDPAPAPLPNPAPMPSPDAPWQAVGTGAGYALVRKEKGDDQIRLACVPGGGANGAGRLLVWVGPFNPIGSEERLTIGFDDQVFGVVAASTKPGPGVDGEGAIPTAELAALPTARTVGFSYGAQTLEVAAPDKALGEAFVEACKQAAEG